MNILKKFAYRKNFDMQNGRTAEQDYPLSWKSLFQTELLNQPEKNSENCDKSVEFIRYLGWAKSDQMEEFESNIIEHEKMHQMKLDRCCVLFDHLNGNKLDSCNWKFC